MVQKRLNTSKAIEYISLWMLPFSMHLRLLSNLSSNQKT